MQRLETLEVGSNVLAGTDPEVVVEKVDFMFKRRVGWQNPFGNGEAGG